jgi:hypothetical protein
MCHACPGCALSNPTRGKSSELVYNFPIEAPFLVMHFDAYAAGKHSGFEGLDVYLIGCCGMCSFACMEPVTNPSATTFASAIMKILLRYCFCHTAVLDKDTKFYGVCREALDLLQINCHVLSSANHNPMLVERINRYLTKGLKIMCNERDLVRIANEAILLLLYAWNSHPVPGMDISCSLTAIGCEFGFSHRLFQQEALGVDFITQAPSSPTPRNWQRACPRAARLLSFSSRSRGHTTASSSMPAGPILECTQSATSSLLGVQSDPAPPESRWISCNTHLPALGSSKPN